MLHEPTGKPKYPDGAMQAFERAFDSNEGIDEAALHHVSEYDAAYVKAGTDPSNPLNHLDVLAKAAINELAASDDLEKRQLASEMLWTQQVCSLAQQEIASTDSLSLPPYTSTPEGAAPKSTVRAKVGLLLSSAVVMGTILGVINTTGEKSETIVTVTDTDQSAEAAAALKALTTLPGLNQLHLCEAELTAEATVMKYKEGHPEFYKSDQYHGPSSAALIDAAAFAREYRVPCDTPHNGKSVFKVIVNGTPMELEPVNVAPYFDTDYVCSDIYNAKANVEANGRDMSVPDELEDIIHEQRVALAKATGRNCE